MPIKKRRKERIKKTKAKRRTGFPDLRDREGLFIGIPKMNE